MAVSGNHKRLWAMACAIGLSVGTARARADDETSAAAPPRVKVERTASGQKIFRITDAIVVEGKIQKPNAFYVLQRSAIDYEWETLKQDFLPRIHEATEKSPF